MGEIRRVGRHGAGCVAKLVNSQLWKIHAAAIGEATVTAKLAGLERDVWWDAMKGGAPESVILSHHAPSIFVGERTPRWEVEAPDK